MLKLLCTTLFVLLVTGCVSYDSTKHYEFQKRLNELRSDWKKRGISSYEYSSVPLCFTRIRCAVFDPKPPALITVTNGVVTGESVYFSHSGKTIMNKPHKSRLTIDQYYDMLQSAIDRGVDVISRSKSDLQSQPSFDYKYPVPLEAYIEIERGNEETSYGFVIKNFHPL